jgi:hypothetical protein
MQEDQLVRFVGEARESDEHLGTRQRGRLHATCVMQIAIACIYPAVHFLKFLFDARTA